MFYTVYRITNRKNNKIYVGVHQTYDLSDSYMGSGVAIKAAIKHHGLRHFTKEYLAIFDNYDEMMRMEAQIVNEQFVASRSTYNQQLGGQSRSHRQPIIK